MKVSSHLLLLFAIGLHTPEPEIGQDVDPRQLKEETEDYFQNWLSEDAIYIITPEEESVFKALTTEEEKERFIEQFWLRRDRDPQTAENEFKEEHYRRIAYANQWFKSGKAGWMTDRGRIYILYGPPDTIESHPSGGTYQRPMSEGGGFTSTFPFEVWRYRHIEGIGEEVELEFVDRIGGGEYRLALEADEKDALLHVPGAGLTWAESKGLASKRDRELQKYSGRAALQAQDTPFERYEEYVRVQTAPEIRFKDLQTIVTTKLTFSRLPFKMREDYFRLNEDQILAAITVELENRHLTYRGQSGTHSAQLAVYGRITGINDRLMLEFEDDLLSAYPAREVQEGMLARSVYQKILPLDARMPCKIDLVLKDLNSGNTGVLSRALHHPLFEEPLSASSLLFSSEVRRAEPSQPGDMFVLGDLFIRPQMDNHFELGSPIGVYLQVYHVLLGQSDSSPDLAIRYRILTDDRVVWEVDDPGDSIYSYSSRRVVLIKPLPSRLLTAGRYQFEARIHDRISDRSLTISGEFQVKSSSADS